MSRLKLYSVTIERVVLVGAESSSEAYKTAIANEGDCALNEPESFSIDEIKDKSEIPKEWIGSIAYTSRKNHDERVTEDYFNPAYDKALTDSE